VTAAGWQPVTHAACDNPKILVERFGPGPDGNVFLTLLNDTAEAQTGTLKADFKALGLKRESTAQELVSGDSGKPSGKGWQITLDPREAEVLQLGAMAR
jgi:hypothetical protein